MTFRILHAASLLAIGAAFVANAARQKRRRGRTSWRLPEARRPAVLLADALFWLAVAAWVGASVAGILAPASRRSLAALAHAPIPWLQAAGAAAALAGTGLILWGFASLGDAFRTSIDFREDVRLVTRGLYGHIRHPMAGGLILSGWGAALLLQTGAAAAAALGLTVANLLRVRNEESFLARTRGREFARYARRVPRFFV